MYGSNFGSKFGKCMGQFSFSPRHIPTKKNLEPTDTPKLTNVCSGNDTVIEFIFLLLVYSYRKINCMWCKTAFTDLSEDAQMRVI